jgi:hypothetical protein
MKDNEDRLQQDCYIWFHNTYPNLRGLLCYNLNNSRNKIAGAINRSMGLQKGRSDFSFYTPGGRAVMIEMKTLDGVQRNDQKEWQRAVESAGYRYELCRTIEQFKKIIIQALDIPEPNEQTEMKFK